MANHIEPNATQVNFNHSLTGNGNVKFGSKSRPIFGPNYNGANYNGNLLIGGGTGAPVALVSNVADNGTFLRAGGIINVVNQKQLLQSMEQIHLKGNINTNNNTIGLVINKNQSSLV